MRQGYFQFLTSVMCQYQCWFVNDQGQVNYNIGIKIKVGIKMDQQSQPTLLPSLHKIPQSQILQNLTHHFLSPTTKPIPYTNFFSQHLQWHINALTYLYSFCRANHHSKSVHQIFSKALPLIQKKGLDCISQQQERSMEKQRQKVGKIVDSIVNWDGAGPVKVRVLLSRYIGLPAMMGEYMAMRGCNVKIAETIIVEQIIRVMERLSMDQQVMLANKITTLNYTQKLLGKISMQNLVDMYRLLTQKQQIVQQIIKQLLESQKNNCKYKQLSKLLQQILEYHNTSDPDIIAKITKSQHFLPQQATLLWDLLAAYRHQTLINAVFDQLVVWWAKGNDFYLFYDLVKFRANLLALIIRQLTQQQLMLTSPQISLGIQKRLMTMVENKREVVNLVWGVLATRMGFKIQFKYELLKNTEKTKQQKQQTQEQKQENQPKLGSQQSQAPRKQPKNEQETSSNNTQQIEQLQQIQQINPKAPRNLYDCILGLRNPHRKSLTLQLLPKIIRHNPDDLIFVWKDLITTLLFDLNQESLQTVIALFVTKPEQFVDSVSHVFFNKDHSLNDKIVLIHALQKGVQELSHQPKIAQQDTSHEQFYFKKVTSKYLHEKDQKPQQVVQKKQERSRRWGHTRISYQSRLDNPKKNTINLKIINNAPYINRLYEIANHLFFKIISKLVIMPIFPSQPMFTRPMLQLLSTLSENLKNHIDKYRILNQVVEICLQVLEYMGQRGKKVDGKLEKQYVRKWKDTNLAVLHAINKVSLVIDRNIPSATLELLEKCVVKLKCSHEYGVTPIINMIEANIYTNVSGQKINF